MISAPRISKTERKIGCIKKVRDVYVIRFTVRFPFIRTVYRSTDDGDTLHQTPFGLYKQPYKNLPALAHATIEDILENLDQISDPVLRTTVRNKGKGF